MFCSATQRKYLLHGAFFLLVLLVVRGALRTPNVEFGDGREYVIQTQSIVFDGTLSIDPLRRAAYWNATSPFDVRLNASPRVVPAQESVGERRQFGGNFGALYLDTHGSFRYVHAWVYSLVVASLYALLHAISPPFSEYQAFRVTNIILLLVPLIALWRTHACLSTLAFLALVSASPIAAHLQFAHSEIFCFSCAFSGFLTATRRRWRFVSPLLIGIGAAQNIPIALFLPLHMWLRWKVREGDADRSIRSFVRDQCGPYALAVAAPLGMMVYTWYVFGVPNLIAALDQADLGYLSVRRMVSVYLSPIIGNVWYFPASWVAIVWALTSGRGRLAVWFILSTLLVSALSSTTSNLYSAQFSACRYAVWYLAPLYVLPFVPVVEGIASGWTALVRTTMTIAWLGALLVQVSLGTWHFLSGAWGAFAPLRRARPEVASLYRLTHFADDIEPLVENIAGAELRQPYNFSGVYVWNLGSKESLWIVSLRSLRQTPRIVVRSSGDLAQDTGVLEVFDVERSSSSEFVLLGRAVDTPERHPIFGGYKLLWVSSSVEQIGGNVPTVLRPYGGGG